MEENGHTYHRYNEGSQSSEFSTLKIAHTNVGYFLPNDKVGQLFCPHKSLTNTTYIQRRSKRDLVFHELKNWKPQLIGIDIQHQLFLLTFHNKLYLAPISDDVQNVLDIGTGTGIWAIDFGTTRAALPTWKVNHSSNLPQRTATPRPT
jgi:hypothetical protein